MDNPNPVAVSLDDIRRQNQARLRRQRFRNLWISDWAQYFDDQSDADEGSRVSRFTSCNLSSFENLEIARDLFDSEEVFDLIRNLTDPEHPLTLEQLSVVSPKLINVNNMKGNVKIYFTPTIPHCSQATLIGLMIRAKLIRCLPSRFKVDVYITPGTHNTEEAINKQLNDKERVAAALENPSILRVINRGVAEDAEELFTWAIV